MQKSWKIVGTNREKSSHEKDERKNSGERKHTRIHNVNVLIIYCRVLVRFERARNDPVAWDHGTTLDSMAMVTNTSGIYTKPHTHMAPRAKSSWLHPSNTNTHMWIHIFSHNPTSINSMARCIKEPIRHLNERARSHIHKRAANYKKKHETSFTNKKHRFHFSCTHFTRFSLPFFTFFLCPSYYCIRYSIVHFLTLLAEMWFFFSVCSCFAVALLCSSKLHHIRGINAGYNERTREPEREREKEEEHCQNQNQFAKGWVVRRQFPFSSFYSFAKYFIWIFLSFLEGLILAETSF